VGARGGSRCTPGLVTLEAARKVYTASAEYGSRPWRSRQSTTAKTWSSLMVSPCAARTPDVHAAKRFRCEASCLTFPWLACCRPRSIGRPTVYKAPQHQLPSSYEPGAVTVSSARPCGICAHARLACCIITVKQVPARLCYAAGARLPTQAVVGHCGVALVCHHPLHECLRASSNLVVASVDVPPGLSSNGLCHVRKHLRAHSTFSPGTTALAQWMCTMRNTA